MEFPKSLSFMGTGSKSTRHKRNNNEDLAGLMLAECLPSDTGGPHNAGFLFAIDGVGSANGKVAADIIYRQIQLPMAKLMANRFEFLHETDRHSRKTQIYNAFHEIIKTVNEGLLRELQKTEYDRALATISMCFILGGRVYSANLGDSPILLYHMDRNGIVTGGPELLYEQQNAAGPAFRDPDIPRNAPSLANLSRRLTTNVLGTEINYQEVFFKETELPECSVLLIGTDGALSVLPDEKMTDLLQSTAFNQNPMESFVDKLYTIVDDYYPTARDNFTIIAQKINCF